MRITILNGNPSADENGFDDYLSRLEAVLLDVGHTVRLLIVREMEIKHCAGCFGCWLKTPGECVARDDSAGICRAAVNSDLLVFASPLIMGFTSAVLKRAHDKFISLVHPYIEIYQGELHHVARYAKMPRLALLLAPEPDTDDEDIAIVAQIYRRDAINFQSSLACVMTTNETVEEVAHAFGDR